MDNIKSTTEFKEILQNNMAVLAYFSHEKCSVCVTLKPKLEAHFINHYPNFKLIYVDIEKHPEIAGANSIFTAPVILVYFEGKESFRKARSMGIQEIAELVNRPYNLIFS